MPNQQPVPVPARHRRLKSISTVQSPQSPRSNLDLGSPKSKMRLRDYLDLNQAMRSRSKNKPKVKQNQNNSQQKKQMKKQIDTVRSSIHKSTKVISETMEMIKGHFHELNHKLHDPNEEDIINIVAIDKIIEKQLLTALEQVNSAMEDRQLSHQASLQILDQL